MNRSPEDPRAAFDQASGRLGWTVFAAKLRSSRNRIAVTRRRSPVATSLHFGLVVPAVIGFTALLTAGFASTMSIVEDEALATTLLAVVIALSAVGAFIGSSTTALQALYLSEDVPFLLTLPIPLRVLFSSKFIEAAAGTAPAGILLLSAIVGYGLIHAERLLYWPAALLVMAGFAGITTSVSVVVVSLVARFIPPRRARIFLLSISLVVITTTIMTWRLLAPKPDLAGKAVNRDQYASLWNTLSITPAGWAARMMSEAAAGSLATTAVFIGLFAGIAAVAIGASFRVFRGSFIRGLEQTRTVQTSVPNEFLTSWLGRAAGLLPHRAGAAVLKEWLQLFRDLRRLSGAIWPVGIVLVYTILLSRNDSSDFGGGDLAFWSRNGALVLLPWGLSLGIAIYSYGSEGRNIQLLRSLPLAPSTIFFAKVVASFMPVAVLSLGAAALSLWLRQAPLMQSLELLWLMLWMIAGYVIIDTSAAALAPNFDADQIQRTIGLAGRFFSFAAGGIFSISTMLGAGRLILMLEDEPESLSDVLQVNAVGIELFGWPLILVAGAIAVFVLTTTVRLAIRQTERIMIEPV